MTTTTLFAQPSVEDAAKRRNIAWEQSPDIPSWVDLDTVDLDRFYTRPDVAEYCTASLLAIMEQDHADLERYEFVEPGAGRGAFYDLLPAGRRIGIDILPERSEFVEHDFLTWEPAVKKRYATIGNPPFGYRAWLALAFLNHAATFADYIGFIVPMAFQSDGKGSPKHRVVGAELVHSEPVPAKSFTDSEGRIIAINALWQVWRRGVNNQPPPQTCDSWADLFTVDWRKERLCGQERLSEADWFIQRTYFNEQPDLVNDFHDVRYSCGYGIVLKREPEAITQLLRETDWDRYSNLAAHNCRHISMYHIRQAIIDGGFVD